MHVIVVGCGRVGSSLAQQLTQQGHTVAVIDRNAEALRRLPEDFAGTTIVGIGFDRDRLIEAGVERAGALAAVTNGDNSNVLIARVARENFGIERVVARIYDTRRATIYQRLGLATVATVAWTTDQVMRRLLPDVAAAEWTDPTAQVCVVERPIGKQFIGRPITDLEESTGTRVAAVGRMGSALVAGPKTVGQEGDLVYLTVAADGVAALDEMLGTATPADEDEHDHSAGGH